MNRRNFISSVIGGLASAVAAPFVLTRTVIFADVSTVRGYDPIKSQVLCSVNGKKKWITLTTCGSDEYFIDWWTIGSKHA